MSQSDSSHAGHRHDHGHEHDHDHGHSFTTAADRLAHAETQAEKRIDFKIVAVLAGGVILVAAMLARFLFETPEQGTFLAILAAILLGGPIVVDAAFELLGRDPHGHGHGHPDTHEEHQQIGHTHGSHMLALIALAILASFAAGRYYEAAAVAFFMLLAEFIESRTAVGAAAAIESLIKITPTRATKITGESATGQAPPEIEIEAKDLRPGDRVVIRPGDLIPGDGVIREGQSTIDQASITGESLPVEKGSGDEVFSGTVNETGRLIVEITKAGEDSTLGQVQKLILQAAGTKPAVVRLLEQYAAYYLPASLLITGIVTLFLYQLGNTEVALDTGISLLLILCPSAIVISGPTAMVAALSAAARVGVLIKSVSDLEVARRITAIVFDKTGTLTTGQMAVTRMKPIDGVDGAEMLRLCASVEKESRHPLARAVVRVANKAKLELADVRDFQETQGRGVAATVEGRRILVGRDSWLREQGVDFTAVETGGTEALSLLFIASEGKCIGWVGLTDTARVDAKASLGRLDELNVRRRVMITGDRTSAAQKTAGELGVSDVYAEALPGDKLKLVEDLRDAGHTVAVVGDGVNDGPALAAGHVSIAMGAAGSDVAINAASIALMNNRLDRIPFVVHLSRRTVAVIRQNLLVVLVYVVAMLALLTMGFITPLIAAIAHGIIDVIVVFNSARLFREGEDLSMPAEGETAGTSRPRMTLQRVAAGGAPNAAGAAGGPAPATA
ncbi:MAG: heavy metal translocating P-type ATPase [Phycisphaeraceae bacterium]